MPARSQHGTGGLATTTDEPATIKSFYFVERMEPRIQMDGVAAFFAGAPTSDEGANYLLSLATTNVSPEHVDHWIIDWGDGSDPDGDGVATHKVLGNPGSVGHVYSDGTAARNISAVAYLGSGGAVPATTLVLDDWTEQTSPGMGKGRIESLLRRAAKKTLLLLELSSGRRVAWRTLKTT